MRKSAEKKESEREEADVRGVKGKRGKMSDGFNLFQLIYYHNVNEDLSLKLTKNVSKLCNSKESFVCIIILYCTWVTIYIDCLC